MRLDRQRQLLERGPVKSSLALEKYFSAVVDAGVHPRPTNLKFYYEFFFRGLPLENRTVLEIGGGSGLLSYYVASRGARQVVCLEPEAAGSNPQARNRFLALQQRLDLDAVSLVPETIQDFAWTLEKFDLVVLNHSINHIDEAACVDLGVDADAKLEYKRVFRKVASLTRPSGKLIVTDCARHNAYGMLGLSNRLVRTVEWHKHQSPWVWAQLLQECGYVNPEIRWLAPNILRAPGRLLLGNRLGAFFLDSRFYLRMARE